MGRIHVTTQAARSVFLGWFPSPHVAPSGAEPGKVTPELLVAGVLEVEALDGDVNVS